MARRTSPDEPPLAGILVQIHGGTDAHHKGGDHADEHKQSCADQWPCNAAAGVRIGLFILDDCVWICLRKLNEIRGSHRLLLAIAICIIDEGLRHAGEKIGIDDLAAFLGENRA